MDKFFDRALKSLRARTSGIRVTRWVRFGIVALIWLLFTFWVDNAWLLLGIPVLFDIYITGYVPLTWWKHSRSKVTRKVMAWVDAIVYALVLVFFIFGFIGQNYSIPSSSLEKTLLTGDYLFVNKLTYGPRVPMTPVHFPLAHNTMPIIGGKSYLEWPRIGYHRLKGFRKVESGDIVVFNFPAGDTVMSRIQNPDYYQLVRLYGYDRVNNNPTQFGQKFTRPVDRRENYVKRVVGLPGERLSIVNGVVHINGVPQAMPDKAQFNYYFQTDGRRLTDADWEALDVSVDDRHDIRISPSDIPGLRAAGFTVNGDGVNISVPPIYMAPFTSEALSQLQSKPFIHNIIREPATNDPLGIFPFELADRDGWTRSDYGGSDGILIPAKGMTVGLDYDNWLLYERAIRVYENHPDAYWDYNRGYAVVNGSKAPTYTFGMDYYFMMGDNRDNSLDSRYWGFVPEDHIVGTPMIVLISFDKDKSIFTGGIRWNRFLRDPNPDK